MNIVTYVPIRNRRALNQALIFARRLPLIAGAPAAAHARALRSALRMSQAQLARRSGVPQAHIARLEAGAVDVRLSTLARLFDAMFCDLIVLPRARLTPSEAIARRRAEQANRRYGRLWDA